MLCEQVARFAGDAGVSAWYLLRAAFVYNYQSSCCSIRRSSENSGQTDSHSVWRLRCVHQCVLEQVCEGAAGLPEGRAELSHEHGLDITVQDF